jgi:hypothetical protein
MRSTHLIGYDKRGRVAVVRPGTLDIPPAP